VGELTAVKRQLLSRQAAEVLREAIFSGVYPAGERLIESDLASSLELSRGPVREALRQLEQEGLISSRPHVGAVVAEIDHEDLRDALDIREYLETFRARQVVQEVTEAQLLELEDLIRTMREAAEARRAPEVAEADFQFHLNLVAWSGSSLVASAWRSIRGQIRLGLAETNNYYEVLIGDVADSHIPMLQALRSRDSRGFRDLVRRHIDQTRQLLDDGQKPSRKLRGSNNSEIAYAVSKASVHAILKKGGTLHA